MSYNNTRDFLIVVSKLSLYVCMYVCYHLDVSLIKSFSMGLLRSQLHTISSDHSNLWKATDVNPVLTIAFHCILAMGEKFISNEC